MNKTENDSTVKKLSNDELTYIVGGADDAEDGGPMPSVSHGMCSTSYIPNLMCCPLSEVERMAHADSGECAGCRYGSGAVHSASPKKKTEWSLFRRWRRK